MFIGDASSVDPFYKAVNERDGDSRVMIKKRRGNLNIGQQQDKRYKP